MTFLKDGIIHPKLWAEMGARKVLFILKEPGANPEKYGMNYESLQDLIMRCDKGRARGSFIAIARWAYALQNISGNEHPKFEDANDIARRDDAFVRSAIINLKKIPCTDKTTAVDEVALAKYVGENALMIAEQIREIAPDFAVCCGESVWNLAQKYLVGKVTKDGKPVFLRTCHFSARHWKGADGKTHRSAKDKYELLFQLSK